MIYADSLRNKPDDNYNYFNLTGSGLVLPKSHVHPFVASATLAWSDHYPLIIKPSHIWLLILQRVATHVAANKDELKSKWIRSEFINCTCITDQDGKIALEFVSTSDGSDEMICGYDEYSEACQNAFESGIESFIEQIKYYTKPDVESLIDLDLNWSQSERIAFFATMMKTVEHWFSFEFVPTCGFPRITLYGTKSDWKLLKSTMINLLDLKCTNQFSQVMKPVWISILDQFINAFDANINPLFWNSMIKQQFEHLGCARRDPYVSGWINFFFDGIGNDPLPFDEKEDYVWQWVPAYHNRSRKLKYFPNGIYDVEIKHFILKDVKLHSGFVGVRQNEIDLAIEPVIGWYVIAS